MAEGVSEEVASPRPCFAGEGNTCAVGVGSDPIDAGVIGGLSIDIGWCGALGDKI